MAAVRIGERAKAFCEQEKAIHVNKLASAIGCTKPGAWYWLWRQVKRGKARAERNGRTVYFVF